MKTYILQDLNDPNKLKVESRSSSAGTICEAPKDSNGNYITDITTIVINDIQPTMTQPVQSLDANGNPIFETLQRQTYDLDGNLILDANGDPVLENYQSPVYDLDANGNVVTQEVPFGDTYKEASVDPALKAARDAELTQASKNAKLEKIRVVRKPLLEEVDLMVNDLALGDRTDTAAVKAYRDELKALTDPYKDANGDAIALIDSLNDDMSDLVLPTKP